MSANIDVFFSYFFFENNFKFSFSNKDVAQEMTHVLLTFSLDKKIMFSTDRTDSAGFLCL